MNLRRFVIVLLLLTGLGTVLGGVSGALLGAAVPGQVTISGQGSSQRGPTQPNQPIQPNQSGAASGSMTVFAGADRQPFVVGGALGAGLGLMAGVAAGLGLGVLDQILLAVGAGRRKGETVHE